jgi:2-iminoacetate synthase ThiH
MATVDSFGRRINYLRLSLADRCNLRCRYCMPPVGMAPLGKGQLLSDDELVEVSREAVAIGVGKIRITGSIRSQKMPATPLCPCLKSEAESTAHMMMPREHRPE